MSPASDRVSGANTAACAGPGRLSGVMSLCARPEVPRPALQARVDPLAGDRVWCAGAPARDGHGPVHGGFSGEARPGAGVP